MNNFDFFSNRLNNNLHPYQRELLKERLLNNSNPWYNSIQEEIYKKSFTYIIEFLEYKGINIDPTELSEFIDSRQLVEKLHKNNKNKIIDNK